MTAFPKPTTLRDPAYLKWLRAQVCCWCGARPPSQAAHHGGGRGVSTKGPDHHATALCQRCHALSHASMTPANARELAQRGEVWVVTAASFRVLMEVEAIKSRRRYAVEMGGSGAAWAQSVWSEMTETERDEVRDRLPAHVRRLIKERKP